MTLTQGSARPGTLPRCAPPCGRTGLRLAGEETGTLGAPGATGTRRQRPPEGTFVLAGRGVFRVSVLGAALIVPTAPSLASRRSSVSHTGNQGRACLRAPKSGSWFSLIPSKFLPKYCVFLHFPVSILVTFGFCYYTI